MNDCDQAQDETGRTSSHGSAATRRQRALLLSVGRAVTRSRNPPHGGRTAGPAAPIGRREDGVKVAARNAGRSATAPPPRCFVRRRAPTRLTVPPRHST